jgi:NAD(P)-dependent dehydrogenase (short-subunit alcohol dehydrogenase family)
MSSSARGAAPSFDDADPHRDPGFDATRFEGRVAIVTGGGSQADGIGNGRAAAILLARRGARVLVLDHHLAAAQATADRITSEGGIAQALHTDVTQDAACKYAVDYAVQAWGRVDVLINNVGIGGPPGDATALDLDAWDAAMRVNVTSMMLMARHAVPVMVAQGKGAIVNLASVAGLLGSYTGLLYQTSKGAVVNMTRGMATQHAAQGIRVNCVAPGMVYTPMVYAAGMPPEVREARRKRSLLRTEGSGWDVGEAVVFLASDAARWITGAVLPVDAGTTATSGRIAPG